MNVGDSVKILEPFAQTFPDTYVIREIQGTTAFLDGIPPDFADAFDLIFLVLA